jgi:RNA-directed DNA polymerase
MYTDALWDEWAKQEEENYQLVKEKSGNLKRKYLKKGYQHFDPRFWFPEQKAVVQKILRDRLKKFNTSSKRMEWYPFSPFIKALIKTPRFKFQPDEEHFDLETKTRPICYASHVDSLILGFYSFALTRQYESYISQQGFSNCVLAYRSNLEGKCNIQFSKEVFDEVKKRKTCTAIALDIKGYFDHIDHSILLDKWRKIVGGNLPEDQYKIYKALTQYTYVNRSSFLKKYNINLRKIDSPLISLLQFVPGEKTFEKYDRLRGDQLLVKNIKPNKKTGRLMGVPQGSAISALLSNIYLIDFDLMMNEKAEREGFLYRRYSDDIMIVCESDKALELQQYTIDTIKKDYLLTIQDKKVELTLFKENSKGINRGFNLKPILKDSIIIDQTNEKNYYRDLQYLGFEFNGQRINVRSSSLSRYFRKMTSRIVKTVSMAYSGKGDSNRIWQEQLLHRYTHLGKRNFLSYIYNASKKEYTNGLGQVKEGMNDPAIRKQVRRHVEILKRKLLAKNVQRFLYKYKKKPMALRWFK